MGFAGGFATGFGVAIALLAGIVWFAGSNDRRKNAEMARPRSRIWGSFLKPIRSDEP